MNRENAFDNRIHALAKSSCHRFLVQPAVQPAEKCSASGSRTRGRLPVSGIRRGPDNRNPEHRYVASTDGSAGQGAQGLHPFRLGYAAALTNRLRIPCRYEANHEAGALRSLRYPDPAACSGARVQMWQPHSNAAAADSDDGRRQSLRGAAARSPVPAESICHHPRPGAGQHARTCRRHDR